MSRRKASWPTIVPGYATAAKRVKARTEKRVTWALTGEVPHQQHPSCHVARPLARHPQEQCYPQPRLMRHERQNDSRACRRDGGGDYLVRGARAKPAEAAGHGALHGADDERRRAERQDPAIDRAAEQVHVCADDRVDEERDGGPGAAEAGRQPQSSL